VRSTEKATSPSARNNIKADLKSAAMHSGINSYNAVVHTFTKQPLDLKKKLNNQYLHFFAAWLVK
jgi:hypothetical protein